MGRARAGGGNTSRSWVRNRFSANHASPISRGRARGWPGLLPPPAATGSAPPAMNATRRWGNGFVVIRRSATGSFPNQDFRPHQRATAFACPGMMQLTLSSRACDRPI